MSGYWQIQMDEASRDRTAFVSNTFKVMSFGLCNAPATFQRLMEAVLHGLSWKICLIYLDDVVISPKTLMSTCNIFPQFSTGSEMQISNLSLLNATLLSQT